MTPPDASLRTHQALAAPTRADIWSLLRRAEHPLTVQEVAGQSGLHPNTARIHLDLLVDAGLASREAEKSVAPGRPKSLYSWLPGPDEKVEFGYEALAKVLAAQVATSDDPIGLAKAAGEQWAREIEADSNRPKEATADEAQREVIAILGRLGFEPEQTADDIHLHRCPFASAARENRAVVCGVHVGMLQALVDDMGGQLEVQGLRPFVSDDPLLCTLRLRRSSAATAKSSSTPAQQRAARRNQ